MKRFVMYMGILLTSILLLTACGDAESSRNATELTNNERDAKETSAQDDEVEEVASPIPEELIENANLDPPELIDQYGLKIGDTGYAVEGISTNTFEFTLNSVQMLEEFQGNRDAFFQNDEGGKYILANFTVTNHGEIPISGGDLTYPDVVDGENLDRIKDDDISRSDMLGTGITLIKFDDSFAAEGIDVGETVTADMLLYTISSVDSYIIYFGRENYKNKIAFEFDHDEVEHVD